IAGRARLPFRGVDHGLVHISTVLRDVLAGIIPPDERDEALELRDHLLRPEGTQEVGLGHSTGRGHAPHGPLLEPRQHQRGTLRSGFLRAYGHGLHSGSGVYSHGSAVSCASSQGVYEDAEARRACQGVSYGSAQVSYRTEFRRRLRQGRAGALLLFAGGSRAGGRKVRSTLSGLRPTWWGFDVGTTGVVARYKAPCLA